MSGFTFGAPPATTGGFSFGAPPAQTATPTFGVPTTSFGTQLTQITTVAPLFGAQTTAAPAFGTQAPTPLQISAQAAPVFGTPAFGTPTTAVQAMAAFGKPTTAAPTLGAQTAAPATNFSFGAPTVTSAVAAPAFSFAVAPTATATTTATGTAPMLNLGGGAFSFAKPPATTSASINFGTTTTSTAPGLGLFAKTATTAATAPAIAPAPFLGLGGNDVSASQPKAGDSKQDVKVKETQVPDEIARTVNALKAHIKAQKTLSSDIGRTSTSKLSSVSGEIMNLQWSLQEIANTVETNYNHIKQLRKETSKTIQSVEMAQRTQDTPAGLQFENAAPFQFFQNMVLKYEQDLINFRQQIALTERHMHSITNPQTVSPEDLKRCLQQLSESFISLAGRLHEIHQKVEAQKEQFLNLRKYRLRDATNVFAKLDNPPELVEDASRLRNFTGPTPFSNISNFGKTFASTGTASSSVQTAK